MESMERAANVSEQGQHQESRREGSAEHRGGSDAVGLPRHAEYAPYPDTRPGDDGAVVEAARRVGETMLGPRAQESDRASAPNPVCIRALADAGLLGMGLPRQYGGLAASGAAQHEVSEILASYCGVTTFTQMQHYGPSFMICNGPNQELKDRLLPDLASGRRLCAISFAHLRRPGPPILCATPTDGGYRLNGTTPWVTGWGLMDQVVFGATLPDERFVSLWVPGRREDFADVFANIDAPDGKWGRLTASAPLSLCAMNASATVELTCDNLWVPDAHRLFQSDRETMHRNDRSSVLSATAMPIGCAIGSVRLLCETAERRHLSAIGRAAASFGRELEELRGQIREWSGRTAEPDFFAHAVQLRAHVIDVAVRAALASVAANSGGANSLSHSAQRLYREAMFYTIQAQTQDVMDATLARLERPA